MKRSKAYRQASEQIDRTRLYSPAEAVTIAKANQVTKFDPTVEVALRLGVDPRKQDQMVRGTVNLPNGTGKTARVLVFATGDRAEVRIGRAAIDSIVPATVSVMPQGLDVQLSQQELADLVQVQAAFFLICFNGS